MAHTVLIVDDEPGILELVRFTLEQEGFQVEEAQEGRTGLEIFERLQPDLILLDLMLPGMNGMDVCREIREKSNVPIIMLTARDSEVDQVLGLELGADDYVVKPFRPRELVARINAVLRRASARTASPPAGGERQIIRSGGIKLDADRFEVFAEGRRIDLTPTEFDLLKALMLASGRVLTRDYLLETVWEYHGGVDTRTVDVHIRRLRRKLGDNPEDPRYIETLRGRGYRLRTH